MSTDTKIRDIMKQIRHYSEEQLYLIKLEVQDIETRRQIDVYESFLKTLWKTYWELVDLSIQECKQIFVALKKAFEKYENDNPLFNPVKLELDEEYIPTKKPDFSFLKKEVRDKLNL